MIIDNLHLYNGKGQANLTPDDKVERMRKDIDIELVRDRDNSISAFKISFTAPSPYVAQEVTNKLTRLFIDENLKVRQQQSEDTTHFIQSQLSAARDSLAKQEAKVRDFQLAHQGELPAQQQTNLQILSGLQAQLQSEQDALNTAKQQRVYAQTLVDQYHTIQMTTRHTPDGSPANLAALDAQLEKMRAQLADLSAHYTDNYPDVQHLKGEIARTEKNREKLIASLKENPGADQQAASTPPDPTQNAPLLQLQGQLRATQNEIVNREQAIADLKGRIGEYQRRLNAEPASEQQLAELNRGYDQSKANYDDLLKKENESQMATSMEQLQQGERFTMLDPPTLPLKPAFPNRLKFCAMGLAVGIFLGAAVVALLEFFDDRMHSDKEIKKLLPATIIAEVPMIQTAEDERRRRREAVLGWATAAAVFLCLLAGSAFSYLHS
jgi:polysaccharide chain length determinant protein (PEP-CTERM system associated)